MSRALQKIDDRVRNLIDLGKERGYVIQDEVNAVLPAATRTSAEVKSLFSAFEHHNIQVFESASAAKAAIHLPPETSHLGIEGREDAGPDEEAEVEEASHPTDKNNDAVRVYLREMGRVPLLKREGEVAIAKRMERGHALVLRTISRSPLVLKEIIAIGKDIVKGTRSIREVVQFDEEDLTVKKIEKITRNTLKTIEKIEKQYAVALRQADRLNDIPKSSGNAHLRARWQLARTRVEMSQLVRSIRFHPLERKRLIDELRRTVEAEALGRESARLERHSGTASRALWHTSLSN